MGIKGTVGLGDEMSGRVYDGGMWWVDCKV